MVNCARPQEMNAQVPGVGTVVSGTLRAGTVRNQPASATKLDRPLRVDVSSCRSLHILVVDVSVFLLALVCGTNEYPAYRSDLALFCWAVIL